VVVVVAVGGASLAVLSEREGDVSKGNTIGDEFLSILA
jgi:hypothetical protein